MNVAHRPALALFFIFAVSFPLLFNLTVAVPVFLLVVTALVIAASALAVPGLILPGIGNSGH